MRGLVRSFDVSYEPFLYTIELGSRRSWTDDATARGREAYSMSCVYFRYLGITYRIPGKSMNRSMLTSILPLILPPLLQTTPLLPHFTSSATIWVPLKEYILMSSKTMRLPSSVPLRLPIDESEATTMLR